MSSSKLYEIGNARLILDRVLEENDGELTPELETELDELDEAFTEKAERVALFIREQLSRAKGVREERDRLDAIVKRGERAAENLKDYLKRQMERLEKKKIDGVLVTIAIQNNPPSVKTPLNSDELQKHYDKVSDYVVEVPATYRIDRDKVLAASKMGATLPEWVTVESGTHLRIR